MRFFVPVLLIDLATRCAGRCIPFLRPITEEVIVIAPQDSGMRFHRYTPFLVTGHAPPVSAQSAELVLTGQDAAYAKLAPNTHLYCAVGHVFSVS